jgi:integrase
MAKKQKTPQPQWDGTNLVWRWRDPVIKKHIRLAKSPSKSNREGLKAAREALERYLADRENQSVVPGGKSTLKGGLEEQAGQWIAKQRRRANKGLHSHDFARKGANAVNKFIEIVGDGSVDRLSRSKTIETYTDGMLESDLAPKTISNHYGYIRRFINDLYKAEVLDVPPRNLDEITIQVPVKHDKSQFTIPQLKETHKYLASWNTKLWECWFLLGLNCGLQEADISELRKGDWKRVKPNGCATFMRLDRRRTKTIKHKNVPKMEHCLWKRTWELLLKFSKHKVEGERIFLRPNGKPLKFETGNSSNNYFPVPWKNIIHDAVPENPLGFVSLRKTGANLCEKRIPGSKHPYLAHGYKSIADIHYANFPLEKLDQVLSWIEKDLGLVDELVIRSPEMITNPRRPSQ